jgi:hypothetical protein
VRAVGGLIEAVRDRSDGRCETLVDGGRCDARAVEVHHRLPRSRARLGDEHLLDLAGDVENLADLCGVHHRFAHARPHDAATVGLVGLFGDRSPAGRRVGLYVSGSVSLSTDGTLRYVGGSGEYAGRVPTLRVR